MASANKWTEMYFPCSNVKPNSQQVLVIEFLFNQLVGSGWVGVITKIKIHGDYLNWWDLSQLLALMRDSIVYYSRNFSFRFQYMVIYGKLNVLRLAFYVESSLIDVTSDSFPLVAGKASSGFSIGMYSRSSSRWTVPFMRYLAFFRRAMLIG